MLLYGDGDRVDRDSCSGGIFSSYCGDGSGCFNNCHGNCSSDSVINRETEMRVIYSLNCELLLVFQHVEKTLF